jgi:23S rRNA (cytidine1920-2'-O)/16S rRNA (cytidine1409-2'-O)-methyltransferase
MRLDLYLTQNFDIQSRNKASELIKNKKVRVDSQVITKPSFDVAEDSNIELLEEDFYVSRAAYKLKYFLEEIDLDLSNLKALDIGSSTGGFTQILLEKNVENVTCVDVGSNQLHERIKDNSKITF